MAKTTCKHLLAAAVTSLMLTGCSALPDIGLPSLNLGSMFESDLEKAAAARYTEMSVEQALQLAQATFEKAETENLKFYAPRHFSEADDALTDAKKAIAKKEAKTDIFEELYRSEMKVEEGLKTKAIVETQLAEPLRFLSVLDQRNADQSFPREYSNVADEVQDLIQLVEAGKTDKAKKNTPELVKTMQQLEVKTIKYNALNDGITRLQRAKGLGADKIAPALYTQASSAQQKADTFIQLNPYEEEQITTLASAFNFAVNHVLHISQETIALQGVEKNNLVNVVLQQEALLQEIADALQLGDLRDKSIREQVTVLVTQSSQIRHQAEQAPQLKADLIAQQAVTESIKTELATTKAELAKAAETNTALLAEIATLRAAQTTAKSAEEEPTSAATTEPDAEAEAVTPAAPAE